MEVVSLAMKLYQYSRSWVSSSLTVKIERNVYVASYRERLRRMMLNFFGILNLSIKYLKNAIFRTILAFQMSVLKRFEKNFFGSNWSHSVTIWRNLNVAPYFGCETGTYPWSWILIYGVFKPAVQSFNLNICFRFTRFDSVDWSHHRFRQTPSLPPPNPLSSLTPLMVSTVFIWKNHNPLGWFVAYQIQVVGATKCQSIP